MSKKLFVGGLSWGTNDEQLKTAFSTFGTVTDAKVILDRDSGRSRGFGFVSFDDPAAAQQAIQEMDGQELDGRVIRVNEAQEKPRPARTDDRSGGGGGGGGGGGASGSSNPRVDPHRSESRPSNGGPRFSDRRKSRDDKDAGDRFSRRRNAQSRRFKPGFDEFDGDEGDIDPEY